MKANNSIQPLSTYISIDLDEVKSKLTSLIKKLRADR
jgi:hypothetical protein